MPSSTTCPLSITNILSQCRTVESRCAIKIIVRPVDDVLQISIADTGVGISEADLGIIFEEFKQASGPGRDPRSGAGLGLAICRQLLALMDGRIWAESTVGKGSTFHVVVPLYAGQDALIAAPEAPAEQLVLSN